MESDVPFLCFFCIFLLSVPGLFLASDATRPGGVGGVFVFFGWLVFLLGVTWALDRCWSRRKDNDD